MNAQTRHDLTDEQWERIVPHLPPQHPETGRPAKDHRTVLNGILWRVRSGAAWRDIPPRYGNWQTLYSRFRRWREAGIWQRVFEAVRADARADKQLEETLAMLDGSSVRAHQDAAGAHQKGGPMVARPSAAAVVDGAPSCIC